MRHLHVERSEAGSLRYRVGGPNEQLLIMEQRSHSTVPGAEQVRGDPAGSRPTIEQCDRAARGPARVLLPVIETWSFRIRR